MSEQIEQQNEQTADSQTTLDDVYKQYGVEGVSRQFQAATAPKPLPTEEPIIPDPVLDPESYKRFQMDQFQRNRQLQESLNQYGSVVSDIVAKEQHRQLEADVNRAVDYVKSKIEGDVDRDLLEVALDLEARRDPRFMQMFEQRGKNPEAWNKALDAFSRKASSKFAMRADPQLVENQRAIKASQQQSGTTRAPAKEDDWEGLSGSEFEAKWRQLAGG